MNGDKTTRTIVWAVVILTAVVVAAVVLLELFADPTRETDAASKVLSVLAPTIAVLATLRAVGAVQGTVERVERDTHALTNGLLDSKVRAGVAEVVHPELVDPAYSDKRVTDQRAVDDAHDGDYGPRR